MCKYFTAIKNNLRNIFLKKDERGKLCMFRELHGGRTVAGAQDIGTLACQ